MGQAQQPPITVIEPENLETVFITGGHIEAIDSQTVRIVAWVDRPTTNSRKIVARVAAPLSVAVELNVQMQEAIAHVMGEPRQRLPAQLVQELKAHRNHDQPGGDE